MKATYLALALICPSVFAAYTTMTLEGVQQANGVWTASGVIDNMGFVRTTGSVTVAGSVATTAVSLPVDKVAASTLLRSASRLAGPASLALAAYEVYNWVTTDTNTPIQNSNGDWYTVNDRIGYCYLPAPIYVNANNYALSNCLAAAEAKAQPSDKPVVLCPASDNNWYLKPKSCGPGSAYGYFSPQSTISSPSTEADFNRLMAPTWAIISAGFANLPSLIGKIPVTSTTFTPFSTWLSDPYFKDGNWFRDRADISPCPTASQPNRVCVDIGPQKFEGATDPQTVPSQATGTATGSTTKEPTDFCTKNPQSISCQEMGQLEEEPLENDEVQFNLDTNQSWGSSNASCPASPTITIHSGQTITFNYQPACDFFSLLRPIIIAFSLLTAVSIAIGRTE